MNKTLPYSGQGEQNKEGEIGFFNKNKRFYRFLLIKIRNWYYKIFFAVDNTIVFLIEYWLKRLSLEGFANFWPTYNKEILRFLMAHLIVFVWNMEKNQGSKIKAQNCAVVWIP